MRTSHRPTSSCVSHGQRLAALSALLLCVLSMSGCVGMVSTTTEMRTLHREIEARVFHAATRAFSHTDYAEATALLRRFVRQYPRSPRLSEARWWLARAYQETGDMTAAAASFRRVAGTPNPYQVEALRRAVRLEASLPPPSPRGAVTGMLVSLDDLQRADAASVAAVRRAAAGSVLLLDIPCDVDGRAPRPDRRVSPDTLQSIIQGPHDRGASVYLGVTLKCLGHLAPRGQDAPERWKDRDYHPPSGTLRRSPYYSLRDNGYRTFLVKWFAQLRDLPLAGLVFRGDESPAWREGFSPEAVRAFERAFDVEFHPARILKKAADTVSGAAAVFGASDIPAVLWKWAGWKARERSRLLRDVVEAARDRLPHVRFGREVRLQGVADPAYGLMHFAEDWMEAARGPFDVLLTTVTAASAASASSRPAPHGSPAPQASSVPQASSPPRLTQWANHVLRVVRRVGTPENIWVILPRRLSPAPDNARWLPEGVGRVYDYRAAP